MQPNDYRIQIPQQDSLGGVRSVLGLAETLEGIRANKAKAELAGTQRQIELDEAAVKKAAAAQLQSDLMSLSKNPSIEGIVKTMVQYPHLSEGLNRGLNALSNEERKARVAEGQQVFFALANDDIKTATELLNSNATALRESGNGKRAQLYEQLSKAIQLNPKAAMTNLGMLLATDMGMEKFQETFKTLEDQRRARMTEGDAAREAAAKATKAERDAEVAAVASKYAESNAVLDIQQKGWNIAQLQNDIDIKKQNLKIAQAELQLKKNADSRDAARLQADLDRLKKEREDVVKTKTAELEQSMGNIDNMLNTLEGVLSSKALDDVVGPIEGSDFYPTTIAAMATRGINIINPFYTPTSADERKSTIAEVNKLIAQSFTTQLEKMRGLGHLSNVEGEKIQSAFANFSRNQGEEGFRASAQEARRLLMKERERIAKKYGMPAPTVDTPKAPGSRPPLESFDR